MTAAQQPTDSALTHDVPVVTTCQLGVSNELREAASFLLKQQRECPKFNQLDRLSTGTKTKFKHHRHIFNFVRIYEFPTLYFNRGLVFMR